MEQVGLRGCFTRAPSNCVLIVDPQALTTAVVRGGRDWHPAPSDKPLTKPMNVNTRRTIRQMAANSAVMSLDRLDAVVRCFAAR